MVLSEAEGFLKMARADLATALESSDPARFREARSHDLARLLLMLKDASAAIDDYENLSG